MDNNVRAAVDDAFERLFEAVETVESMTPPETLSSDEESQVQPLTDIEDSASENEADDEQDSLNADVMARNFERYRALARDRRRATIRFSRNGLHRRLMAGRILFEVDGVPEIVAREALYKASAKLPIKCKIIKR